MICMAILAIFTGKGFSKEKYEALRPEVNWEHDKPVGGVFHAASFDEEDNIHVADVWESEEAMNNFVQSRLMPAFQKLNIPQPSVDIYRVETWTGTINRSL